MCDHVKRFADYLLHYILFVFDFGAESLEAILWNVDFWAKYFFSPPAFDHALIAQEPGWEDETRIFQRAILTLPRKGHFLWLSCRISAEVTMFLSLNDEILVLLLLIETLCQIQLNGRSSRLWLLAVELWTFSFVLQRRLKAQKVIKDSRENLNKIPKLIVAHHSIGLLVAFQAGVVVLYLREDCP
jgi:hypothetical protein